MMHAAAHRTVFTACAVILGLFSAPSVRAQTDSAGIDELPAPQFPAFEPELLLRPLPAAPPRKPASVFNQQRILGVIPDYQTVNGSAPPLTVKQKWELAYRESIDPFNIFTAGIGAAFSQADNETPEYGVGGAAFGERFGAAFADATTQNFFSAGLLATVLHQDPRYFRMGPRGRIGKRVLYSLSRLFVAYQDSGKAAFNASGIGGMVMGIAASNLYYPGPSRRGTVMAERVETSLFSGVTGNLMAEFWPDIREKFFRNGILHRKKPQP
jgi:hypothetical protein